MRSPKTLLITTALPAAGAGLADAAATLSSAGGVVLAAAVLHAVMTAWCLAELRR